MPNAVSIEQIFIDQPLIIQWMKRRGESALRRFGAFVWQRQRTLIKKGTGISSAGDPPLSHTERLRSGIKFAADQKSVVIGPVVTPSTDPLAPKPLYGTIATALEEGGEEKVEEVFYAGRWRSARLAPQSAARAPRRTRVVTVEARPSAKPAFDYVIQNEMAKIWQG